jgi:isoleucyl-tRNA synthetase
MDEQGRKMSKSMGNVTAPQEVIDKFGADILRLWVVSSDYSEDLRIGAEILKHQSEHYRRMRNTLRYLLGALDGYSKAEAVEPKDMPELERWVLHRLAELDKIVRKSVDDFDFHTLFTEIHAFAAVDLSAFYFDVRKDALYCDKPSSLRRRAARTVMDRILSCLTAWLAPVLCFTAEEAWLHRAGAVADDTSESVHLRVFPTVPASWRDDALASKWEVIRDIRRVVTGALELERAAKRIGASLQAAPAVYLTSTQMSALNGLDAAEIAITSGVKLTVGDGPADAFRLSDVAGVAVVPGLAEGQRCERCWKVLPEVGNKGKPLCRRCDDAVAA